MTQYMQQQHAPTISRVCRALCSLAFVFVLFVPAGASAQVVFTEIMYAPEGADATHEWVEVCNTGTASESIGDWKFFEGEVNHSLSLVSGTEILESGACAIIADNASVFQTDYTSFNDTLFDSLFSLKNTGESISLKNGASEVVDTVAYTNAWGAENDGNSLHKKGSEWVAGTPTPGVFAAANIAQSQGSEGSAGVASAPSYIYQTVTIQPPEARYIDITVPDTVQAHGMVHMHARTVNAKGDATTEGNITWSFGDGSEGYGRDVVHVYTRPGTYIVVAELREGAFVATTEKRITVREARVALEILRDDSGVRIINSDTVALDMSQWQVRSGGRYFVFPDHTKIPPNGAVVFDSVVTKLGAFRVFTDTRLEYPRGGVAAYATREKEHVQEQPSPVQEAASNYSSGTSPQPEPPLTVPASPQRTMAAVGVMHTPIPSSHDTAPDNGVATSRASSSTSETAVETLTLPASGSRVPALPLFLLTVVLGAVGAWFSRRMPLVVEGFEVIENDAIKKI